MGFSLAVNRHDTARVLSTMRKTILTIYYTALVIAGASLLYLLFIFGHTETAPLPRVLTTAGVAAVSALVAGILQWAGLPKTEDRKEEK
ncbi:MAG: hypothetical protein HYV26_11650 [Candidatus Hydrogenedentes bacterium]|nr:hypothetical protein [Candidatus Hydrogenedentota bacterium]